MASRSRTATPRSGMGEDALLRRGAQRSADAWGPSPRGGRHRSSAQPHPRQDTGQFAVQRAAAARNARVRPARMPQLPTREERLGYLQSFGGPYGGVAVSRAYRRGLFALPFLSAALAVLAILLALAGL